MYYLQTSGAFGLLVLPLHTSASSWIKKYLLIFVEFIFVLVVVHLTFVKAIRQHQNNVGLI